MNTRLLLIAATLVVPVMPAFGCAAQPVEANQTTTAQPPAISEDTDELAWPRVKEANGMKILIYQPQMDSWEGNLLSARCAIALTPVGAKEPQYGVVWLTARTEVDKGARLVTLDEIKVVKSAFPKSPESAETYGKIIDGVMVDSARDIPLDHLEASLAVAQATAKSNAVPVKNDAPMIYVSHNPTMLVLIDGEPVLREVAGTKFMRVINTRAAIFLDSASGTYFLHAMNGWQQSSKPDGSAWAAITVVPAGLDAAYKDLVTAGTVDPLDPHQPDAAPTTPMMFVVSTIPAEMIQTRGEPEFTPIAGTKLLFVSNTDSPLFKMLGTPETYYVLVSGRWFAAPDLSGPWAYVDGKALPADFRMIPADSKKANVLLSVPGTAEAKEAVIANSIPQTASVKISETKLTVAYDGEPKLKGIDGASGLSYVANCALPVIRVDSDRTFWCVNNGVWFTANTPTGPWVVATAIPGIIYTIPVMSPLHYVTYVRVYGVNGDIVYVGYTPGYMGTCVTSDGVVVYGTGYYYPAYVGTTWVGYPPTYGYGAGFACGVATGFAFGFAAGAIIGDAWCPPYWGPCGWGYAHVDINSASVYRNWRGGVTASAHHYEYDGWSGEERRSGIGHTFNPYTGRSGTGGYSNYYNHETHDYDLKAAGTSYNPRTGVIKGGGIHVNGDTDSGNIDIDGAKGRYNTRTNTGVLRTNDDIYAGHDGNVYRYDRDDGTIQKRDGDDWNDVDRQDRQPGAEPRDRSGNVGANGGGQRAGGDGERNSVAQERQARDAGNQRFQRNRSFSGLRGGGGGGGRRR